LVEEYIRTGFWKSETMAEVWDRNARQYPDREGVIDSKRRLTWSQAKQWIDRVVLGFLELGLKRDELIVIQLPNSVELCMLRVVCEKAGVLCLPVLRTLRHKEMGDIIRFTKAAGIVIPWKYRDFDYYAMIENIRPDLPKLRHVFVAGDEVPPGVISLNKLSKEPRGEKYSFDYLKERSYGAMEISLINPTTGTTGFPKFVGYKMCARLIFGRGLVDILSLTHEDVVAALPPAAGGPNLPIYFGAPLAASKIVMLERWKVSDALKLIEKERVTVVCSVPAQLGMIVQHPLIKDYDLSSLKAWFSAGAVLPFNLGKEVEEKLGGMVLSCYGAIDFGGMVMPRSEDPVEVRLLTVGRPQVGTEIKLVNTAGKQVPQGDIGEVWGRGPSCAAGYYQDPKATRQMWTEDGWFKTGDLGKLDEQGNLVIVGRKKDMIIRGGQNIYAIEIENLLLSHQKICEVAIVGMPDPIMGERTCAYVVLEPGESLTLEEVTFFLKDKQIATFKLPERLEIIDKMPLAGDQKFDKKALRAMIAQKIKAKEEQSP
jgi:non-ribosomal peptide synthetase component E (peptide arylation enzyme)